MGLMKKGLEEIVEIVCYSASANTDDHEKILSRSLSDYLVGYWDLKYTL